MRPSYLCFTALVLLFVLFGIRSFWKEREPKLVSVLLPEGRRRVLLEWWQYYSWYDNNGNQIWSKRRVRRQMFTV